MDVYLNVLFTSILGKVSGQLHALAALTPEIEPVPRFSISYNNCLAYRTEYLPYYLKVLVPPPRRHRVGITKREILCCLRE